MKLINIVLLFYFLSHKTFAQNMMNEEKLWKLIDSVNSVKSISSKQKEVLLAQKLSHFSDEDIVMFDLIVNELHYKADTWDLTAVDKIFTNSVWLSDGHYYFCFDVISMGKRVYYKVLKNADELVNHIPDSLPYKNDSYLFDDKDFIVFAGSNAMKIKYKNEGNYKERIYDTLFTRLEYKLINEKKYKDRDSIYDGYKAKSLKELQKRLPKIWKRFQKHRDYELLFDEWIKYD